MSCGQNNTSTWDSDIQDIITWLQYHPIRRLTLVRVGLVRGQGGAGTVHAGPLHPQLLQTPPQVSLLPL